jgi:23S rRNA (adenine2503-C2)-methyltransferase
MGMGEPLNNISIVAESIHRITRLIKTSKRRITLSTAGIVEAIEVLPKIAPSVNLAVSLNATTNETRSAIMPINKRYPLELLLQACKDYPLENRKRITFEYVLLKGVNDSPNDARRLERLVRDIPSKVNLIPFNSFNGSGYEAPQSERVHEFQSILMEGSVTALIRKSKGSDICGACGQLKGLWKAKDSLDLSPVSS